jgi:cytochrome c peroxidase
LIEMMKTHFLILGTFMAFVVACRPDDEKDINPSTTPYDLKENAPAYFGPYEEPEDNLTTVEGVDLGRHLFFDKILSRDSSVSCASCHHPSMSFTDGAAVSLGIRGQQTGRSSMSLANLLWREEFFWDGRASSLEEQALAPISNPVEMDLSIVEAVQRLNQSDLYKRKFYAAFGTETVTPSLLGKAIAQFERTLISADSKYDRYKRGEYTPTNTEARGIHLFYTHPNDSLGIRGANCGDCHSGALTHDDIFHNNGLDQSFSDRGRAIVTGNAFDEGKFITPSLRNIELTAPYMHDGRFETLEEVLDHYNEHIQQSETLDPLVSTATNTQNGNALDLTDQEKADVIAFLKMLTDPTFVSNPHYSNPFDQ